MRFQLKVIGIIVDLSMFSESQQARIRAALTIENWNNNWKLK